MGLKISELNRRRRYKHIRYIIRDNFTTDESAPLTDPRSAEPSGEWRIIDPNNVFSISGGQLLDNGSDTGEHALYRNDPVDQTAGVFMGFIATKDDTENYPLMYFGTAAGTNFSVSRPYIQYLASGYAPRNTGNTSLLDVAAGETAEIIMVAGSTKEYYFGRLSGDNWQLLWINNILDVGVYYPTIQYTNSVSQTDTIRVGQLPAPFTTDTALERFRVDGNVPVGYTNDTVDADFILEFTLDELPSSGTITTEFRQKDSLNNMVFDINSSGTLQLYRRVNNSPTLLENASAAAAGQVIRLLVRGNKISGFNADTRAWANEDDNQFLRQTGFEIVSLGTGGAISDLRLYRAYLRDETGLGNELLTNGGFSQWTNDDPDGWNVAEDANNFVTRDGTNDRVRIVAAPDGVTNPSLEQSVLTEGNYYQITIDIESITGVLRFRTGSSNFNTFSNAGVYSFYILAPTSAPIALDAQNSISELDATINSVSIRKVEFSDIPAGKLLNEVLS